MQDKLISFKVAKLLRKKGHNCESFYHYYYDDEDNSYSIRENSAHLFIACERGLHTEAHSLSQLALNVSSESSRNLLAPTQSLVQEWIREARGVHIEIYANASGWGWILTKTGGNGSTIKAIEGDTFFDSYGDALEEGLKQALRLI